MKKIISICLIVFISFVCLCIPNIANAVEMPFYDETFNNNGGALYANGNKVIIDTDGVGNTIVSWNGGDQVVPPTVTIFGGGTVGTTYETSNITMENGTVSNIYGGGFSLNEQSIATVNTANVVINNGTVTNAVSGGGLLFTTVQISNVTINGGTIAGVQGGGIASATISGINYSAGSENDLLNSKCRVDIANVTVNSGTIDSPPSNYGLLYGGGQGYSYTGEANLVVNGGDMSKAYVTSGGSNGYTGNANTLINGGTINIFQTVNRGQMESAEVKINGGTIKRAYVGGETEDSTVNGVIYNINYDVLGGKIEILSSGTSDGKEIEINNENYVVIAVDNVVENNNVTGTKIDISYRLIVKPTSMELYEGETERIETKLETIPAGYENLFENEKITMECDSGNIAVVSEDGVVEGLTPGFANISVKFLDTTQTVAVEVESLAPVILWLQVFTLIIIAIMFVLLFVYF